MRAKKNLIASYIFIIVNIFINLFVVRLTVNHYGEQIYAFVVLAFSFITYVETLNLGTFLSNRTQIPMRGVHASVYTVASVKFLSKISISFLVFFSIFYFFAGDYFISLITTESDVEILKTGKTLISIAVVYGLLKIPLSVVLSAFAGHDLVDIEKKYNGVQQLIKITALGVAVYFGHSVETYFISFTFLGIILLFIANFHYFYRFISSHSAMYMKYSKKISGFYITKNSFKFYVFTMASVVVWSTDNLLVSIFFNPKMVSDYHINFSIYNAGFLFVTAIAGALIANYGNLIRDNKLDTLNFRVNLSVYTTFLISLAIGFGGILFTEDIIRIWVGDGHFVSDDLLIAFGIFGLTLGFSSVLNTILALFADSKTITLMTISEAVLNIVLSVILLKVIGVSGIAYATGIAATITIVIPGVIILSRHFKNEVKIDLVPLIMQIMLCALAVFTYLQSTNHSIFARIITFLVYFGASIFVTALMRRDYVKSYLKMIKK